MQVVLRSKDPTAGGLLRGLVRLLGTEERRQRAAEEGLQGSGRAPRREEGDVGAFFDEDPREVVLKLLEGSGSGEGQMLGRIWKNLKLLLGVGGAGVGGTANRREVEESAKGG